MVSDPRCPECDGRVGTTSTYCMHCGAEFDSPVGGGDDSGGTDTDIVDGASAVGDHSADETATDTDTSDQSTNAALTSWEARLDAWLAPDGWLDNSLTVVVAIVAGIVFGIVGLVVLGVLTQSAWAFPAGFAVWLGSTVYLARKRTVYGAVHDACLGLAGLLFLLPVGFLLDGGSGFVGRIGGFLAGEFVVAFFAVPLLVVGRLVGRIRAKQ